MLLSEEFKKYANETHEAGNVSCTRGLDRGAQCFWGESRAWTRAAELVKPLEAELAKANETITQLEAALGTAMQRPTEVEEEDAEAIAEAAAYATNHNLHPGSTCMTEAKAAGVAQLEKRMAARQEFSVGDRLLMSDCLAGNVLDAAPRIMLITDNSVTHFPRMDECELIPAAPEPPRCECGACVRDNLSTTPWLCDAGVERGYGFFDGEYCPKCGQKLEAPPTSE